MEFQLAKKVFVSGCDCGLPHVDGKIFCSNSDRNEEVIRDQYQLGGCWVVAMDSTNQFLAIVRNNQY